MHTVRDGDVVLCSGSYDGMRGRSLKTVLGSFFSFIHRGALNTHFSHAGFVFIDDGVPYVIDTNMGPNVRKTRFDTFVAKYPGNIYINHVRAVGHPDESVCERDRIEAFVRFLLDGHRYSCPIVDVVKMIVTDDRTSGADAINGRVVDERKAFCSELVGYLLYISGAIDGQRVPRNGLFVPGDVGEDLGSFLSDGYTCQMVRVI
jgi:hypothetical protein